MTFDPGLGRFENMPTNLVGLSPTPMPTFSSIPRSMTKRIAGHTYIYTYRLHYFSSIDFQSSCHSLETHLLFVNCKYSFEENLLFLSANFYQCHTYRHYPTHAILVICNFLKIGFNSKEAHFHLNKSIRLSLL